MNVASIYVLARKLIGAGCDASMLWRSPDDWGDDFGREVDEWIEEVSESLARSVVAAIAVIDVETVIVDGAFPATIRGRVIERTRQAVGRVNRQGLSPFRLVAGSIGNAARAMGGASLPLLANFTQDRQVLFTENASRASPEAR